MNGMNASFCRGRDAALWRPDGAADPTIQNACPQPFASNPFGAAATAFP
jgi:hypothetical protein